MKLREYFRLPVIIGPLPNNLVDGTLADAVPVMADFDWILSQVNANAAPIGSVSSGTYVYVPSSGVGGSANAITLTPSPAAAAYVDGLSYRFVAGSSNTASVTVNVSGLGAKSIVFNTLNNLSGNELIAGVAYDICYSGSFGVFVIMGTVTNSFNFTPTVLFGGGNTGMTFSVNTGVCYKMNDWFFAAIALVFTAKGSSTGVCTIALPVATNPGLGGSGLIPIGACQASNLTYTGQIAPAPVIGSATFKIQLAATGSALSFLADTAFANNTALYATIPFTASI